MATAVQGQPDGKYLNWLRGSVALLCLKEGIEGFTDKRVTDLHEKLHTTVPQPFSRHGPASHQHSQQQASPCVQVCNTCTHYDVKKRNNTWSVGSCSSNACSTWIKYISNYHVDGDDCDIDRYNLKPQLWPSHPWEVAKWFLPTGSKNIQSARDADVAAILKLLMTCTFMFKFHKNPMLVEEVLTIRNRLMHSKDLRVTDDELRQDTGKMLSLLNSLDELTPGETQSVQSALNSISKLQSKTMDLTRDREVIALHQRMQAVDSDLASLKVKCSDYDKTSKDLNRTEQELKSLTQDNKQTKDQIKQLEESKERFEKFVQVNGLDQDLARMSARLKEHDQKLHLQDKRADAQDQKTTQHGHRLDQQDQRSNEQDQRIDQHGHRLDQQDQRSNEQDQRIDQHGHRLDQQDQRSNEQDQRIDQHGQKIHTLAEQMTPALSSQVSTKLETSDGEKHQLQLRPEAPVAGCLSDDKCKDLQELLMGHYKHACLVVQSPLENNDVGLEYMYVPPAIKVLQQSKGRDGLENVKEEVTRMSCKQVFYNKDYQCRNIYITGDAGTGKSMICKHLVRLWCEAHGGIEVVESAESDSDEDTGPAKKMRIDEKKDKFEEDRQTLSQFKFLFYITLRDSLSEYRVTDMIQSQILQHYDTVEGLKLSTLLKKECCIVIIDGLDEWVCPEGSTVPHFVNPGIPGRDITIETSVFLTTTRPWKFDVLQLKSSEMDKHVELIGINKQSASQLCTKVIRILRKRKACSKRKQDFFRTLKERDLDHFKTIPVILVQLIWLWYDDHELPKSQVQLYCDIIEHLLTKAKKNIPRESINTPKDEQSNRDLPECFMDHPYCQNHRQLIHCLSRVAFESLVNKTKENSLVFQSSQMKIFGLEQESVEVCLKSGILSQNTVLEKCYEKKMSFLHKKLQEFLASIFIAASVDSHGFFQQKFTEASNNQITHITDICCTIDTCLELSQVYMFMSGLRKDLTQLLLTHFIHVITDDKLEQVQKYRQTLDGEGLIRNIQTCITDCVVEGSYHGYMYDNLCLADFYITNTTLCHVEPLLLCTKSTEVKSVYMKTGDIDSDQLTAITSQLQQCHSVQKLHLVDPDSLHLYDPYPRIDSDTVAQIVNNNLDTLTCLDLYSRITATAELVSDICSISSKCLMALRLSDVRLTHEHKEQILTRLQQSPTIRQLVLRLDCTDHGDWCQTGRIDLSTMTHIQRLQLSSMSVDNLQSVSHCVEHVILYHVILPVTTLCEFARRLSQTRRDVTVVLYSVTVTEVRERRVDVKTFLRTCHGLKVTLCQYYSDNTWIIHFTTSSQ